MMSKHTPSKILLVAIALLTSLLVAFIAAPVFAQGSGAQGFGNENPPQGYEATGPYAQFGFSIGGVEVENSDDTTVGGFNLTGGYRVNSWVAAEAAFNFLSSAPDDIDYFGFFFGPKLYPLGAFEVPQVPSELQPYGLIQIGGGEVKGEGGFEESLFLARFIVGFDYWLTDQMGLFVEGGGHVSDDDGVDGLGVFSFGGQFRF